MSHGPIPEALEIQLLLAALSRLGDVKLEFNKLTGLWECSQADYTGIGVTMRDAVVHAWGGRAGG